MKKIIIIFTLSFLSVSAFAQKQKITIFCSVDYSGDVYYNVSGSSAKSQLFLSKLLPDSITTTVLIDPEKEYKFKNADETVLWLTQNGWKLVSIVDGAYSLEPRVPRYVLSREISLDAAARALFLQNLENLEIKPAK